MEVRRSNNHFVHNGFPYIGNTIYWIKVKNFDILHKLRLHNPFIPLSQCYVTLENGKLSHKAHTPFELFGLGICGSNIRSIIFILIILTPIDPTCYRSIGVGLFWHC